MLLICHRNTDESEIRMCYEHKGPSEPDGSFREVGRELLRGISSPIETTSDAIEATVRIDVLSRLQNHMGNLRTLVTEGSDGLYRKFTDCPSANKTQFLRDINAQLEPLANDLEKLPKTFKIGKKIISDDMTTLLENARMQMGILVEMGPDWNFTLRAIDLNKEHLDDVKTEAIRATKLLERIQATLRIVWDPHLATATNNNAVNILYAGSRLFD